MCDYFEINFSFTICSNYLVQASGFSKRTRHFPVSLIVLRNSWARLRQSIHHWEIQKWNKIFLRIILALRDVSNKYYTWNHANPRKSKRRGNRKAGMQLPSGSSARTNLTRWATHLKHEAAALLTWSYNTTEFCWQRECRHWQAFQDLLLLRTRLWTSNIKQKIKKNRILLGILRSCVLAGLSLIHI